MSLPQNTYAKKPDTLLTQREIAAVLGVTVHCVIKAENRAVEKFRAIVEREAAAAGCSVREWLYGRSE